MERGYSYLFEGEELAIDLHDLHRKCPNCLRMKPLYAFGLRRMNQGLVRNQSQCIACRGAENG